MQRNLILLFVLFCSSIPLLGQTGVTGSAPVTLTQGPDTCNGDCITVDVAVNLTGLSGNGVSAGLNAFVLTFDLNRSDVFASAKPGSNPQMNWAFVSTERYLVDVTNRLTLVGSVAEPSAPNGNYEVATLTFCGTPGLIVMDLILSDSSLGSKFINGSGPDTISIDPPAPFQADILNGFPLNWGDGLTSWHTHTPAYDLVAPGGRVDVGDLVTLVLCGEP